MEEPQLPSEQDTEDGGVVRRRRHRPASHNEKCTN